MKVLITGSTGFLGGALLNRLSEAGIEVSSLELEDGTRADITDPVAVKRALQGRDVDVLVHLAGYAFVQRSNPGEFYRVNILGTENILNAVTELDIARGGVICASTAGVYGQQESALLSEDLNLSPLNHYSISKAGMEYLVRKYQSERPILVVRPFNIIGIGQNPLFLIPKLVTHFAKRSESIEMGNLDSIRDYVAIDDFCTVILQLCLQKIENEVLNIGSGQGYTVREVLERLESISGHRVRVIQTAQHVRKDDIHSLVADPAKLLSSVAMPNGFAPLDSILSGIYEQAIGQGEAGEV